MPDAVRPAPVVEATGLSAAFGERIALASLDLTVAARRIVGIVGPNGAGKTTALNAILGLSPFSGHLRVLGLDPWRERDRLMPDVGFITDVAVLPRWITVGRLLDYVGAVHPRFNREKAEHFLDGTAITATSRVKDLSKGMVTQVHLALVLAIEARLLVLDEPTLGVDLPSRKRFYDALLADFLEQERSILLATHDIDEIEHVVTDVLFLDRGRALLSASVDEIDARFREVRVHRDRVDAARAHAPFHEREALGQHVMLFDHADAARLEALGDVRRPSLANLFVAMVARGRAS